MQRTQDAKEPPGTFLLCLQPPAQVGTHHSQKNKLPKSLMPTCTQLSTEVHDLFGVALLCATSLDGVCRILGLEASQPHEFLTRRRRSFQLFAS